MKSFSKRERQRDEKYNPYQRALIKIGIFDFKFLFFKTIKINLKYAIVLLNKINIDVFVFNFSFNMLMLF